MRDRRIQNFFEPNPSPITDAILWQYSNTTAIASLVDSKSNWYKTWDDQFWVDWIRDVFNLVTANEFGISVWSIILQVPLFVNIGADIDNSEIWGFNEYTASPPALINTYWNFGGSDGTIGANFSASAGVITLTLEEQRFLLRLKYLKCISRGSIPQTNYNFNWLMTDSIRLGLFSPTTPVANPVIATATSTLSSKTLTGVSTFNGLRVGLGIIGTGIQVGATIASMDLDNSTIVMSTAAIASGTASMSFGAPTAWVLEGLDMTITYQFNFFLSSGLQRAIHAANVLPDPAGVKIITQLWNGSAYVDF